jgi:4-amino-4-deoxy-L-arabinose transferase-like glycosyltransferase
MNNILKGLSTIAARGVYLIYIIFTAVLLFTYITDTTKSYYIYLLVGFLLLCVIGTFILNKVTSFIETYDERKYFFILLFLCFIVKFTWIYFFRIQPYVDYATIYRTAVQLTKSWVIQSRYVALFPHIMGYASFLSIFLKIFGTHHIISPILNVILSTISMALIYKICKKIGGARAAIIASILWILFPSQTIYNMFVLSEPYYSTLLLFIWLLIIIVHEKMPQLNTKKIFLYAVVIGLLLALMNMSRPVAAIPIIALAIWLFIINTGHIDTKMLFQKKAIYFLLIIITYYAMGLAVNKYNTVRLGEEVASIPGYNIYVGFNMNSYGVWNEMDSALLYHYNDQPGWSANDVQKKMLEEAKKRILSGHIDFPTLFYYKFLYLLGDDSAAASIYAPSALGHVERYVVITNVFYYFLLAASLFGVLYALKNKSKSPQFFICLYFIGLTMAHMLTEVEKRYHYSATLSIVILAALGISFISKKGNAEKVNH